MEFEYHRIDMAQSDVRSVIFPLRRGECWYVASKGVLFDRPTPWDFVRQGDMVSIPLVPYLVPAEQSTAWSFVFQLAFRAAHDVPAPPTKVLIVTGFPLVPVEGSDLAQMRFFIGLGLRCNPQSIT